MDEEGRGWGAKWLALGLGVYGLMLAGVGVVAGLVRQPGSGEHAALVVMAWVELATLAVLVPLWVCRGGWEGHDGGVGAIALKVAGFVVVGLAGGLVTVWVTGSHGWVKALLLTGVVASYAVGAVSVSTLTWAILRNRLAGQLAGTLVLMTLLAGPLLANPVIRWAGTEHRRDAINCVSYASALVVTAYAGEMDFYRGPRIYVWSTAGDYAFDVPRASRACILYVGVGVVLTAGLWWLRPGIRRR